MSVFLIDNHRRHCSRSRAKEEAADIMDIDQKEHSDVWPERGASPLRDPPRDTHHESTSGTDRDRERVSALSTSLLSVDMTECKYCEFQEASTDILEHEFYCGSRTDICSQCGQRDTVKNLVELSHQCPAQCPLPPIPFANDQNAENDQNQRSRSNHKHHEHHEAKYHLLSTNSSGDDSADHDQQPNRSNKSNTSFLGQHDIDRNHNRNHNRNCNGNHHGLSVHDHGIHGAADNKPETPSLIRLERERLRQTRARNEERDLEFARNLQRQIEAEEAHQRQEQAQRRQEEAQRQQREEWRRQLIAEQAAEREHERQDMAMLNRLDQLFGGLGSAIRAEAMENQENLDISNMSYAELEELFPNQAQGTSTETINRLPTEIYRKRRDLNVSTNDERNKCCICLEQFEDGQEVRRLQCLHIFHKQEIDEWLRRNRECPICRINVEEHTDDH